MPSGGSSARPAGSEIRRRQTVPVARLLQRLLTPAARKQGFAETAVLADWPEIVGKDMANRCQPIKITRQRRKNEPGTLVVGAAPVMALELQHTAPQIIERINTYFGFKAICRLQLKSTHRRAMPQRKPVEKPVTLTSSQQAFIDRTASDIHDQTLRQALEKLGTTVLTKARL